MLKAMDVGNGSYSLRLLAVALYSSRYPAVGETHGLSLIVGAIDQHFRPHLDELKLIDMVAIGSEDLTMIESAVEETKPNILAISVPYGTYDMLLRCKALIARVLDAGGLAMLGGPLPTYLREQLLKEVDWRVVVIAGEGESASVEAVSRWIQQSPFEGVPGSVVADRDRKPVIGPRGLADVEQIPLPYRGHMGELKRAGAQIFAESSRACSWAACSFCLRGLLDIEGRSHEFRRLPLDRLLRDIQALRHHGISNFTFADEDFLGGSLDDTVNFVSEWQRALDLSSPQLRFDVSATIRSIYDERDSKETSDTKRNLLSQLASIGLNKIFLGIESGSPTQLRRYHKGHTPKEAAEACRRIIESKIALEIGFIMFDPMCSSLEIAENVDFLLGHDIAKYVSGPTSELRLQSESRYLAMFRREEAKSGRKLIGDDFDPNTLSLEYEYMSSEVAHLVAAVRANNAWSHSFVYGVKGLTRFASGMILGDLAGPAKLMLGRYRTNLLLALSNAATNGVDEYGVTSENETKHFAERFIEIVGNDDSLRDHPMVSNTLAFAEKLLI